MPSSDLWCHVKMSGRTPHPGFYKICEFNLSQTWTLSPKIKFVFFWALRIPCVTVERPLPLKTLDVTLDSFNDQSLTIIGGNLMWITWHWRKWQNMSFLSSCHTNISHPILHHHPALSLVVRIKHLNTPSLCRDSEHLNPSSQHRVCVSTRRTRHRNSDVVILVIV